MDDRSIVIWLFFVQGLLGAFDTLYYHEWKARLPALGKVGIPELRLHGIRSVVYALLFGYLPWVRVQGLWAWLVMVIIFLEIFITLADFVVEDKVRESIGGVFPGERVSHAIMAIIYGGVLSHLLPVLWADGLLDSGFLWQPAAVPGWLRLVFILMAIGVFVSGVRDLYACTDRPYAHWPWPKRS